MFLLSVHLKMRDARRTGFWWIALEFLFSPDESLAVVRAEKLRTRSPSLFWKGKISEKAEENRKRSKNGKMPRKTCSQSFLQPNRQSMNEAKTDRTHFKLKVCGSLSPEIISCGSQRSIKVKSWKNPDDDGCDPKSHEKLNLCEKSRKALSKASSNFSIRSGSEQSETKKFDNFGLSQCSKI